MSLINPNEVVLELAQSKGKLINNTNGSYRCNFKQPIYINRGDTLTISQAIINTQDQNDFIRVEKDTNITFKFGYYVTIPNIDTQNQADLQYENFRANRSHVEGATTYSTTSKVGTSDNSGYTLGQRKNVGKYKYYVIYETDTSSIDGRFSPNKLHTNTAVVTIKAGSYAPSQLADEFTDQLSKSNSLIFGLTETNANFEIESSFNTITSPKYAAFTLYKNSEKINVANLSPATDKPDQFDMVAVQNPQSTTDVNFQPIIGATESEVTYVDGKFKIDALHTPMWSDSGSNTAANTLQPVVNNSVNFFEADGGDPSGSSFAKFNQATGLFLLSITDDNNNDLINQMGFGDDFQENFISEDTWNLQDNDIEVEDFEKIITGGFNGNNNLVSEDSGFPAFREAEASGSNAVHQINTESTFGLISKSIASDTDVGYFKVELISGGLNSNMYFDPVNGRQSSISAIVNRNYNSLGYTNSYAESSIPYIHNGEPTILNDIQVNILKPSTNKVFDNLGADSTIFLNIQRAPQQQEKK